jgi:hypothetical protein
MALTSAAGLCYSGAHNRTSAPSARNCTACPTTGPTSPRDPVVDNNTRISRLPFPQVLAAASASAARPGSCRKPPGALYTESGKEWVPSFPFYRPLWTDNLLAKRRRAAYGGTVDPG